jgi:hypothetical protein
VKPFLFPIRLLFVGAVSSIACSGNLSVSDQPQQGNSYSAPVMDSARFIDNLRAAGARVEPEGEVDQPFFAVKGMMIKVHGEDVQLFQYSNGDRPKLG